MHSGFLNVNLVTHLAFCLNQVSGNQVEIVCYTSVNVYKWSRDAASAENYACGRAKGL